MSNRTDEEIMAALARAEGSIKRAAQDLDMPRSTLGKHLARRPELRGVPPRAASKSRLSRESLNNALQPPNNCTVKKFLDTLTGDDREIVEEALEYNSRDFNAGALREWLMSCGFKETQLPSTGAISDHRRGARPCRCKG